MTVSVFDYIAEEAKVELYGELMHHIVLKQAGIKDDEHLERLDSIIDHFLDIAYQLGYEADRRPLGS